MRAVSRLIGQLKKEDEGETDSDTKARQNVATALAQRLQTQGMALRRAQTDFMKRVQGSENRQNDLFAADPNVRDEEFDMVRREK